MLDSIAKLLMDLDIDKSNEQFFGETLAYGKFNNLWGQITCALKLVFQVK